MSIFDETPLAECRAAIGRAVTRTQLLDRASLHRFAVATGGDGDIDRAIPALGHWAWFLDAVPDDRLGDDGHPARGGFLPAVAALPRRMFASATIRFAAPLLLDEPATGVSEIVDVRHKRGRSGDLLFVDVERRIFQGDSVRRIEQQTVVYRAADATKPLPVPAKDEPAVPVGLLWQPSPVHLFRFSAATFNGHRIHYDAPYAREAEGYPALIVHGPFTAARLADLAAQRGALASFEFRAQAPLFAGQPIRLVSAPDGTFQAVRCDGVIATIAKATYR